MLAGGGGGGDVTEEKRCLSCGGGVCLGKMTEVRKRRTVVERSDRLLRMVKSLSPKVVTLVEQESNTNTAAFFPKNHKQRINVEQHCLARDVVNIIACEGADRVERHELLGKWRSRFEMAGFTPYPLSSLVNSTIRSLLRNYSDKYRLEERDGASLYLGWMKRDLVISGAWK
ncbi:hypothetical protein Bca101_020534 [Brassica carinata]